MRVAVQIDRSLAHLVPRPESVMAEDQVMIVSAYFGIVLDARPTLRFSGRYWIVITNYQVFAPA